MRCPAACICVATRCRSSTRCGMGQPHGARLPARRSGAAAAARPSFRCSIVRWCLRCGGAATCSRRRRLARCSNCSGTRKPAGRRPATKPPEHHPATAITARAGMPRARSARPAAPLGSRCSSARAGPALARAGPWRRDAAVERTGQARALAEEPLQRAGQVLIARCPPLGDGIRLGSRPVAAIGQCPPVRPRHR